MFSIENAAQGREALQRAVDRIVAIIQADPNKDRIDTIITRWLKRHLQRLGAVVNLDRLNSLVEDRDMLAENLENWAKKERQEGREEGEVVGERRMLQRLLTKRFGELPTWAVQKLDAADAQQLEVWTDEILVVGSLDALFKH
ncbi:DUF4351 domain-containing protein [Stutzerimonas kunmingensis]|uniref:DUF4351 domain-containing protein n=1 Tax=Stutzerimonas kunmingensis TaxID=1211807 RepID=UPI00241F11F8|nr:DUF4351 domain-containing protein [Stutzerimonas kunmingensis]